MSRMNFESLSVYVKIMLKLSLEKMLRTGLNSLTTGFGSEALENN
jgi:hypothetical protein